MFYFSRVVETATRTETARTHGMTGKGDMSDKRPHTLLRAAANGDHGEVRRIIAGSGCDPDERGPDGVTALHLAARYGHVKTVQVLIAAGAETETPSTDGWTALHFAANEGNPAVIDVLLAAGARIDEQSNAGSTALHYAVWNGNLQSVDVLLEHGADRTIVNNMGWTAAEIAQHNVQDAIAVYLEDDPLRRADKARKERMAQEAEALRRYAKNRPRLDGPHKQ